MCATPASSTLSIGRLFAELVLRAYPSVLVLGCVELMCSYPVWGNFALLQPPEESPAVVVVLSGVLLFFGLMVYCSLSYFMLAGLVSGTVMLFGFSVFQLSRLGRLVLIPSHVILVLSAVSRLVFSGGVFLTYAISLGEGEVMAYAPSHEAGFMALIAFFSFRLSYRARMYLGKHDWAGS